MRPSVVLVVAIALAAPAPAADLALRQRVTDVAGAPPHEETLWITATGLVTDAPDVRTIVDVPGRTRTVVTPSSRTYTVATFDELDRERRAIDHRFRTLAPETQERVRAAMQFETPVAIRPTGRTADVAGHPAREWAVSGGMLSGTLWTTDALAVPAAVAERQALAATGATLGAGLRLAEAMRAAPGLVLRSAITTDFGWERHTREVEVTAVTEASPPAGLAHVPDGFERQRRPDAAGAP